MNLVVISYDFHNFYRRSFLTRITLHVTKLYPSWLNSVRTSTVAMHNTTLIRGGGGGGGPSGKTSQENSGEYPRMRWESVRESGESRRNISPDILLIFENLNRTVALQKFSLQFSLLFSMHSHAFSCLFSLEFTQIWNPEIYIDLYKTCVDTCQKQISWEQIQVPQIRSYPGSSKPYIWQ